MSAPAARRLAWSLWSLMLLLGIGVVVLAVLNRDAALPEGYRSEPLLDVLYGVAVLAFATIGALVASRRPRNANGWILLGGGMSMAVSGFTEAYAVRALYADPGGLPGGTTAAWLSAWVYVPSLFLLASLLFLIFPTGRLPEPRWRWALWLVVAAASAATVDAALGPVLDDAPFEGVANPLPVEVPAGVLNVLSYFGWPGMALGLLLAAVAMILRLRRSRGVERQQLKWIASVAAVLPPIILAGVIAFYAGSEGVGGAVVILAFLPIPLAAGYAILHHRLYDIDLVINRALVYGSLTALLAGAYVGLVLLSGLALSPLAEGSGVAVAVSTLAVAALFQPLRHRLQRLVDRRFYRRRYDAARTLAGFSARLQSQTDLDALRFDLAGVVKETMQPAHVSVWLRGAGR